MMMALLQKKKNVLLLWEILPVILNEIHSKIYYYFGFVSCA